MAVLCTHDTASPEYHLVLGKSACLVRKDILDLPEVLCDIERSALHAPVCLLIIQVDIISDEEDLPHFDQLDAHIERDGNQHLLNRDAAAGFRHVTVLGPGARKISLKYANLHLDTHVNSTCRRMIMVKNT